MGADQDAGQTDLNYTVPERYGDSRGFQAGSTFKPFVLAAAVDQGVSLRTTIRSPERIQTPLSSFDDCDGPLAARGTWEPANSTGSGTFDLYSGTQQSVNTPSMPRWSNARACASRTGWPSRWA